jgi:hypothetical protein
MKLVGLLICCLLLAGCAGRDSSERQPPATSSTEESLPVGDAEERLEVASRLRRELRDQKAEVVVNGTKLVVTYKSAAVEDAADDFLQRQGTAGMARIANAGFETLIISARDSTKEIPVASYRTK